MWTQRLDLAGPLIVAPMAGGPTTPELVAATSEAGALGMLDGVYRSPDALHTAMARVRGLTRRPFGVNLFVPTILPPLDHARVERARRAMRANCTALGPFDAPLRAPFGEDFARQLATVLQHRPAVVSFTFGLPERGWVEQCHARAILVVGTATTYEEAQQLQRVGVDAVVAQGSEAGGHRGMLDAAAPDAGLGTEALCRTLAGRLDIPFFAAGGIMNGAGVAAVLKLGAAAAQLGTAFLLCTEAGTSKPYREALQRQPHVPTALTRAFSGRLARGVENAFMRAMRDAGDALLPFPAQNSLTSAMRQRSVAQGSSDYCSLWAGTGYPALQSMGAGQLVRQLLQQAAVG